MKKNDKPTLEEAVPGTAAEGEIHMRIKRVGPKRLNKEEPEPTGEVAAEAPLEDYEIVQSPYNGFEDYYRKITSIDIGQIAREVLNGRITQFAEQTLFCDCPNHKRRSRRSLHVMLDLQRWYCSDCATGGDVLQLVEFVHTGCVTRGQSGPMPESHREARDFLAAKAAMPSLSLAGLSPEAVEAIERERGTSLRVFEALTALADHYYGNLLFNMRVLLWLTDTCGIDSKLIERLKVGYAENDQWCDWGGREHPSVLDQLCNGQNAFTYAELLRTGAFRPSGRNISPVFNRNIVFPYWSRGHVVYVSGGMTPWTPSTWWASEVQESCRSKP